MRLPPNVTGCRDAMSGNPTRLNRVWPKMAVSVQCWRRREDRSLPGDIANALKYPQPRWMPHARCESSESPMHSTSVHWRRVPHFVQIANALNYTQPRTRPEVPAVGASSKEAKGLRGICARSPRLPSHNLSPPATSRLEDTTCM